jgi:hypothetical protein
MMKEGHLDLDTIRTLAAPRAAPRATTAATASGTLPVRVSRMASTAPLSDICEPTEMSKSPEIRTSPTPTATMPTIEICPRTLMMFWGLMKFRFIRVMLCKPTMKERRNPTGLRETDCLLRGARLS